MDTEAKLLKLFESRDKLHPLTYTLISYFQQSLVNRGIELSDYDIEYIESIYPIYFGERNEVV